LYAASGWGLFSHDLKTGIGTDHGLLGFSLAGDLTFVNGKMYGVTFDRELVEINVEKPTESKIIHVYAEIPISTTPWGIVSDVVNCDSTNVYLTCVTSDQTNNPVYRVNFETQAVTQICTVPFVVTGAATPTEFRASDCSLHLDLDADDSSTATGSDYFAPPRCGPTPIAVADTDAVLLSGYRLDSVGIRLMPPIPDGIAEYLTATPAGGEIAVLGQNTHHLRLQGTSATAAGEADYQAVIRTVRWHNAAAALTPGPRTVQVIAYTKSGRADTAYATLPVPQSVFAGRDSALARCVDASMFDLGLALSSGTTPGGAWLPSTSSGGSLFNPAVDLPGTYIYTVTNGLCPPDTALVDVAVHPLPVFSLGPDTSFCLGSHLTLVAPFSVVWPDGGIDTDYTVAQSEQVIAEAFSSVGCSFRDTVTVSVLPIFQTAEAIQRCAGQTYVWNGQQFDSDTLVCASFEALNSCDSTHCVAISFFYPTLAADTVLCSGKSLDWHGASLTTSGFYRDTVLMNGCLTALSLDLTVLSPDTSMLYVTVCPDSTYTLAGQMFAQSGEYAVPTKTLEGCGEVTLLFLTVLLKPSTPVSASICAGEEYDFHGKKLTGSGLYRDTLISDSGCDSIVLLTLSVWPLPKPVIVGDTLLCFGGETTLSTGIFAGYAWSSGSNESSTEVSNSGYVSVTVTDVHGCQGTGSAQVLSMPPITAVWDTASPHCYGGTDGYANATSVIGGLPPYTFQMNGGVSVGTPDFSNLSAGNYMLRTTDAAGCNVDFGFSLQDPPVFWVDLGAPPSPLEVGELYSIPLKISKNGPFEYTWWPPDGLSCTTCPNPVVRLSEATTYVLQLTDANGCTTADSLMLRVKKGEGVYVPNAIAPNGAEHNQRFTVYADLAVVKQVGWLRVYDRWGGLIFERINFAPNDESAGWDGTWRGKRVQPGVYAWQSEVLLIDGGTLQKSGSVTIMD